MPLVVKKIWLWIKEGSIYWLKWRYENYRMRRSFIPKPPQDLLLNDGAGN